MPAHPLDPVGASPGAAVVVGEVREACERLRWHPALRRRWAVVRAEAGVRSAASGLALDGVRVPLDLVRDVALGVTQPPSGAQGDAVLGALRVQAEVERALPAPGAATAPPVPLVQQLARWHAVTVGTTPDAGRLRTGAPSDLRGLGPAVDAPEAAARLQALGSLLAASTGRDVPGLVLAAVVLGELMTLRPFDRGNGPVARAAFRHVLTVSGVDPVGAVVPEVLWAERPTVHLAAAARFATGEPDGVAAWVRHCGEAVLRGVVEATEVADGVRDGTFWGRGEGARERE